MRLFPILVATGVIAYGVSDVAELPVLPAARQERQQPFEWKGMLAAGKTIEVKGVNGAIRAMPSSGREVEVSATKREGRRGDVDDVTIEVVEHAGGVTICARYPARPRDQRECKPGHGGQSSENNDTRVDFTVRVPTGVNFAGRTVNGDVDATRLGANVEATTVNGSIDASGAGFVEATTVNGSIRAAMGRADWSRGLEFRTVNGSITLELPAGVGAEVSASTVNGDITTDFPLTIQGRFGPRRIQGVIGDGGRQLRLETVNGGISLRRAG